jgi:putative DNA primase/helicase
LFGLQAAIDSGAEQSVCVVEGEKAALALRRLFGSVVTSAGGAQAASKTDWSPVAGRRVLIWPDNDEPGLKYRDQVVGLIRAVDPATRIKTIDPVKLMRGICEAQGWDYGEKSESMRGWDAADVMELGLEDTVLYDLLANSVVDSPIGIVQGESTMPTVPVVDSSEHVTWHSGKHYEVTLDSVTAWKQQGDQMVPSRVSSCVEILRQLRDRDSEGWSLELRLHKLDGEQQTIIVRRAMLSDSKAFKETFNDLGVLVYNWAEFHDYLAHAVTRNTHDLVRSVGWNGALYVQANRVYGQGAESVALDPEAPACAAFEQQGTLEEWNVQIGRYCEKNSRLMLAVCLSLAGPLLHLLGIEPGGVHLVGQSSVGKTTAMRVASSVWGSVAGFIRSWRSTSNGLEAVAASLNDCVLLLDEMNQATPLEAGEVVYMLGNGQGKMRMTRTGGGGRLYQWRLLFMSTGEIPLQQHIESVGKKVRAGMDVRLLNIPANAGCNLGLFESLDGFECSRALADHLNATAREIFGVAGDTWLTYLTAKVSCGHYQAFGDELKGRLRQIEEQFQTEGDGQVTRAVQRFALLALAGELAVEAGIGGWASGTPTAMMRCCFDAWIRERGGTQAAEEMQALRQAQQFFERHGQADFQRIVSGVSDPLDMTRTVVNRAGYVTVEDGTFYVLPEAFKNRVCDGLDHRFVAEILRKHGLLLADTSNTVRVPGVGSIRAWQISCRIVGYSPESSER